MSLTTGQDVSGVLVGSAGTTSTAGNDTFFATNTTLQAGDSVNGGAGTDTLFFTDSSVTGVNLVATALSSIENLYVQNVAGTTTAGAKETVTLTFNAVTTASSSGAVTIAFANTTVTVAAESATASAVQVATAVANSTFTGFVVKSIDGATVVLESTTVGNQTNISPVVSLGTGGAMAIPTVAIVNGIATVTTAVTQTVDATTLTDTVQFWNNASTNDVTFSNIQQAATIGVKGVTAGSETTAGFVAAVTKGTADSVSVVFDGSTDAGTVTVGTAGAGFETVNVTAIGENKVAALTTAAKTVNITGAGDLEITASLVGAKVIDGSAATGDLTIGAAATGADLTSVKTGSGDDKVSIASANFVTASKLVIDLGAGKDTLVVAGADNVTKVGALKFKGDALSVSGVESLELSSNFVLSADVALNTDGLAVDTLIFGGNVGSDGAGRVLTLSKFSGDAITFKGTVEGATPGTHKVSLTAADVKGALTITTDKDAADLGTITLANATSLNIVTKDAFTSVGITAAKVTTLTVDTGKAATAVDVKAVTAAELKTLTVSGEGDFAAAIQAATTKLTSIDLSGLEGAATIAAGSSAFAGTVTVKIGEGEVGYTAKLASGSREIFQFVGDDIGAVTITGFSIGAGATGDKLDFSQLSGISSLDDLVFAIDTAPSDDTITINAASNASGAKVFDGTITLVVTSVDLDANDITSLVANNIIF